MHFVILGAGALGTLLAGHLARAGHRVQLVARGARADRLAEEGLVICGLSNFHIAGEIVREPATLAHADVFINTVKTYDSVAGLASLSALRPVMALSVQNGVVKEDELEARFGRAAVIGTMADFSGELTEQGAVRFTRNINLHLGERAGQQTTRTDALAAAVHSAGINARAVDNIESIIWSKYVGWLGLMLLAVLTRRYTGEFLQDPDVARVVAQITRETAQLADSRQIPLLDISPMPASRLRTASEDEATVLIQAVGVSMATQAPTHRLSSLQDVLRGRPLEIEETVGYAWRAGSACGLSMPVLGTCYRIAAAINRGLQ